MNLIPLSLGNFAASGAGEVVELVTNSGLVVKFVLLILLTFSVLSWAIIFYKYYQLKKVKAENQQFFDKFWENKNFAETYDLSKRLESSSVGQIFNSSYKELLKITQLKNPQGHSNPSGKEIDGEGNIKRSLNREINLQSTKLESFLIFLATTGSTTPFIGLFGTVWGIMDSFRGIGKLGSANLAVVAPGISEALIATAAGLAAAIPAVVAYNYFLNQVKIITADMDTFSSDFINICRRHFL